MSNQYLSFDVSKVSPKQQLITARQGDGQLKFVTISLWDSSNGKPYGLINRKLVFEALKPDGTHFIDTNSFIVIDRNRGIFRYTFNEQLFAAPGKFQQAFFKITSEDDQGNSITEATLDVGISVLPNMVEFSINSENYLSEYEKLVEEVKKKFDDYSATVAEDEQKLAQLHEDIDNLVQQLARDKVVLFDDVADFDECYIKLVNSANNAQITIDRQKEIDFSEPVLPTVEINIDLIGIGKE